ncbi:MAG: sugar ABC transporter substrate-binding protein [Chloroflexota bacterium]
MTSIAINSLRQVLAVFALLCILIAPAWSAVTAASPGRQLPTSCNTDKPLIGALLPNTVNPYYVAMKQSIEKAAPENGFRISVAVAEDSNERQLAQAQAFIQQKICAAYLNGVDSAPAAAIVKAFNDAGIPVFTVNVIVSKKDMDNQGAHIIQYIGADQVQGGRLMAEEALKDLGATAMIRYGIVGDPEQIPTEQRDTGWNEVMAKNPNAKMVAKVNSKVDPAVSLRVTTDMLQAHPEINVLWADTGPGAVGALRAIQALGRENGVKLYAFCAADIEMKGPYVACAAQEPAKYGQMVIENIKVYVKDGKNVPPEILVPLKLYRGGFPAPGDLG